MLASLLLPLSLVAQFISSDTYTRYELLTPESHQFRIVYDVTETTPLAKFHYNIIRPGSEASDESVYDAATGEPLKFELVTGAQAKKDSPEQTFIPDAHYIKIQLAHQIPAAQGEYRLRIEKTYKDAKSYYATASGSIVFTRPLGIPRNSVVLPAGYELVESTVAAQVLAEPDGRLRLAFMNPGSGGQLDVKVTAKPAAIRASTAKMPAERAHQDREILYELLDPSTNAFRITHDYTESRAGRAHYFNVVRAGSHVTDPVSIDLDSGKPLKFEIMTAREAKARKLPLDEGSDDSEIVVTYLDNPVVPGTSVRLRLMETYTDPKSYFMDNGEMVWTRTFGRPRNTVVLPKGWTITAMDTPAIVQTLADGRVSVYTVNPRNDEVRVWFRARKRE